MNLIFPNENEVMMFFRTHTDFHTVYRISELLVSPHHSNIQADEWQHIRDVLHRLKRDDFLIVKNEGGNIHDEKFGSTPDRVQRYFEKHRFNDVDNLQNKSDDELKEIMRARIENKHLPHSIYHRAKQELDFRRQPGIINHGIISGGPVTAGGNINVGSTDRDSIQKKWWKRPEIYIPILIALISIPWWSTWISHATKIISGKESSVYFDAGEVPIDRTVNATEEYSKIRKLAVGVPISKFQEILGNESFVNKLSNDVVEYVFVNPLYYIEAATDIENNILFYSVTTRDNGFNPKFEFFTKEIDSDEKLIVELGKTTFLELNKSFDEPTYASYLGGANRMYYFEAYYPGRPYQTHIFSINQSGVHGEWPTFTPSSGVLDNREFLGLEITNPEWLKYRETAVINTYTITAPFYGIEEILKLNKEFLGPNYLQVMLVD